MDGFDPRVEYKKQVALKFDYILDNYIKGVDVQKAFNMSSSAYITKLKNPKNSATLNLKHMKILEEKLEIPKEIFYKIYKFDPQKIDEQIVTHRENINKQKIEKKSIHSVSINTQLTLQAGKRSLIGRKIELHEVDTLLEKNALLWVYGIGGVGKSALVNYYLYEQKKHFDYYGFFEGFERFTLELKTSLQLKSETSDELFREAITELRKLKGSKLLVFDDIREIEKKQEQMEIIMGLREYGYRIIFTSRERVEEITVYGLNTLHKDDARKLFNSIYKITKYKLLTEILNHLDYHPLFIELTAKALKNKTTLTPLKIKEKFDYGEFSTVSIKRKESFHNYLDTLFTFDNLDDEEILVLKKLSALPSVEIEFNLLNEMLGVVDKEEFEEILNYLVDKGWLDQVDNSYKLHQIIKEYILDFHLPKFKELTDVVQFFTKKTVNSAENQVAIENRGRVIYFESLYAVLEKINTKNSELSLLFTQIGNVYYFLTPQKSKRFYLKALEISQELFGEYHANTAVNYHSLALFYASIFDYEEAKKLYMKALDINQKVYGKFHLSVSIGYNNLAEIYRVEKNFVKSEEFFLKSLNISEEILGCKDAQTATSYNNIANLYLTMGVYDKAKFFFLKDLKINEEIFGGLHPSTAISYNNLAGVYWSLHENDKAEIFYLKALEINRKVFGKRDLNTLTIQQNIALFYHSINKLDESHKLMREVDLIHSKRGER